MYDERVFLGVSGMSCRTASLGVAVGAGVALQLIQQSRSVVNMMLPSTKGKRL